MPCSMIPEITDIIKARERIQGYVTHTPLLSSRSINSITGSEIFFKCENFQRVGTFKFRGACNAVFSLNRKTLENGVATHSSGNHAAALALAAKEKGVKAYIVMPSNAPEIKKKAVAGYGAEITFCEPNLKSREATLERVVRNTGATVIHPYNNFDVICGQGTAAYEVFQEIEDPDIIITPVGGGGLLSGTAVATKGIFPGTKVYGAEPLGADDAARSFHSGRLIPQENPVTIADGLLTSLGELNFEVIKRYVDDIFTAKEKSIVTAMRMIWERMKIIIEPSSALPLAVILENQGVFIGKRTVVILSGGNVDLDKLPFGKNFE